MRLHFFSVFLLLNAITAFANLPLAQYNHTPVNTTGLLKADIVYYRDFPYKKSYANQQLKNCITLRGAGRVYCKEQVSLLRPAKMVKSWLHTQNKKGYLPFVLKKYGITGVKAHITEVMPAGIRPAKITSAKPAHKNKNRGMLISPYVPVTGIFIRHVLDVSQYTFKNLKTKVTFFVKATPNHPVYAVNKRAFIGISQLSSEDTLLSARGEKIKLVCPDNVKSGCGTAFNRGKITDVYNIETSQRHTYFVQSENMLVHNCGDETAIEDGQNSHYDQITLNQVPHRKSVALVVKNAATGEPELEKPSRYSLDSVIGMQQNRYWTTPANRATILGISDHAGYVAPYDKASSLSLNEDGRLMISTSSQEKELVTDTMETATYKRTAVYTKNPDIAVDDTGSNTFLIIGATGVTGFSVFASFPLPYVVMKLKNQFFNTVPSQKDENEIKPDNRNNKKIEW